MEDDLDQYYKNALAETLDMAVDSLLEMIQFDKEVDNLITKNLSKAQADEIIFWFDDEVIPVYLELEMYDRADKAKKIRNALKKQNENIH